MIGGCSGEAWHASQKTAVFGSLDPEHLAKLPASAVKLTPGTAYRPAGLKGVRPAVIKSAASAASFEVLQAIQVGG